MEPESLVTSEQTPDSAQDPNPGQPEGQGNAADGMEASADTNVKPEASADDSPVIPTTDVDPPTATDDDKKPTQMSSNQARPVSSIMLINQFYYLVKPQKLEIQGS
ncbi:hypothetical protein PCANC_14477 [Puccinia coronata f. sp. avenae]|uniref:Uncharacterized protein n=1 Tax=Puccinia coronata f. sp. avenae TaxID=200324 RepID=A0A2N5USI4_9BASI|nr:hypothetical protein PCANC_14477 [Puccinia coronata f. sp. avenae]